MGRDYWSNDGMSHYKVVAAQQAAFHEAEQAACAANTRAWAKDKGLDDAATTELLEALGLVSYRSVR